MNNQHTLTFKNIFFIAFVWIISQPCQSDAHQERHYVHYMLTALTKADTFNFSNVSLCDDGQIAHYCNDVNPWIRDILAVDDWIDDFPEANDYRDWYKNELYTLSNCTNCTELHCFQRIVGCELEKLPNGTVTSLTAFDEYGFDGEDFISFNYNTMQWIDKSHKAKETKMKWDRQTNYNKLLKFFLKNCMDWISRFNNTQKSKPDVFVSARKSPDDDSKLNLTCLATGFYPRDVQMNIRLNKTELEDQTSSGMRPNANETFQMRISVKIDRNHKGSYDCLVIHSSLTEPVTVEWDGRCFNCEPEPRWFVIGGAAAVLVVLVLLLILAAIYCVYNRRNSDGRVRNPPSYGAVSDQIQMTSAASADVTPS